MPDQELTALQQQLRASTRALSQLRSSGTRDQLSNSLTGWFALCTEQLAVRNALVQRLALLLRDPIGLQAQTRSGCLLLLTGSAQGSGQYQLTRFDAQRTPWGHTSYANLQAALVELLQECDVGSVADLSTGLIGSIDPEINPQSDAELHATESAVAAHHARARF
ncbi:hypothetical protein PuT2_14175 [Pusillimonas sp. T2]|uniref:hypothetical protein n=1 Tax=Pusillimonas sp. T2 TaxID=1548123 RepID=UPI000B9D2A39|nr:hypothetical protein [Pusillimonas sp. T2]OXR48166.1 hypothetical protein PuT2_14175 [Pusillimonas sp. T2]